MRRWLALLLVAAGLLAAAGGARLLLPAAGTGGATAQEQRVPIGGPFALTDQGGRQVTEQDFRGRYMLIYFGYTYCPDICPLGLEKLAQAMDQLPAGQQEQVVPVFVTIDPERDTVEVMRDYVGPFHPRLVGLTGSPEEIAEVARSWRVYVQKAQERDGAYLVDHSTFTYLMGPDGEYVAHFGHAATAEEMAQKIIGTVPAG